MMQHLMIIFAATHYPPKDSWFNWFFGPQILGIVFIIIGSIQYRFPPKSINNWYGYRTGTSQRNQEVWDDAQRYSALYMIKAGLYCVVLGLLIVTVLNLSSLSMEHRFPLLIFSFIVGAMAPTLSMIVMTEKHLTNKFGDK